MTHRNRLLAIVAACCAVLAAAGGSRFASGGLTFEATSDSTARLVLGSTFYRGTIVVPSAVTVPSDGKSLVVTEIGDCGFNGCHGLQAVELPSTINRIGNFAFNACDSLKAVTLPSSLVELGDHAFSGCTMLKAVAIPDAVRRIGDFAFFGCTQVTAVTIGKGVETIGMRAFQRCQQLRSFAVADGNTAFTVSGGYLLADGGTRLLAAARKRTDYRLATLPSAVTVIDDFALSGCDNMVAMTLPAGVARIGHHAFQGCKLLKEVTLPATTVEVGANAFADCNALASVHCTTSEPMALSRYYDPFTLIGRQALMTLYVPTGSAEAYRAASVWSGFGQIVEEESGVESPVCAPAVTVAVSGRTISVTGVAAESVVTVYTVSGAVVASGTSAKVPVAAAGVYIVRAGGKAVKVIVP